MEHRLLFTLGIVLATIGEVPAAQGAKSVDIVVYGGTSSGIVAAIQARNTGKTVVLLEPSQHLGGLTTGGLGSTDIGKKYAIGGLAREFYHRVRLHYRRNDAWVHESPDDYQQRFKRFSLDEETM